MEAIPGLGQFQIIQETRDLVRVRVRVVPDPLYDEETSKRLRSVLAPILPGVRVEIDRTDRIDPEPGGKFRMVLSRVRGG